MLPKKALYDEEDVEDCRILIEDKAAELDPAEVIFELKKTRYINDKGISVKKNLKAFFHFSDTQKDKVDRLKQELEYDPLLKSLIQIKWTFGKGSTFLPIYNIEDLGGKTDVSIQHTPREVLLVVFWTLDEPVALHKLKVCQNILENEANQWEKSVRVVALSLGKDRTALAERVKEHNLTKIHHYYIPEGISHPDVAMYLNKESPLPWMLIVGKGAVIEQIRELNVDEIEPAINKELNPHPIEQLASNFSAQSPKRSPKRKSLLMTTREPNVWKILKQWDFNQMLCFNGMRMIFNVSLQLSTTRTYRQNLHSPTGNKSEPVILQGALTDPVARQVINSLPLEIPQRLIKDEIKRIPILSIDYGATCSKCKKQIKNMLPQYYSFHSKRYYCQECVKAAERTGLEAVVSLNSHPLAYLHGRVGALMSEIFQHRVTDQVQPKSKDTEMTESIYKEVICSRCNEELEGKTKCKCLCCDEYNLCCDCLDEAESNSTSQASPILNIDKLGRGGVDFSAHDHGTHIFLKFYLEDRGY